KNPKHFISSSSFLRCPLLRYAASPSSARSSLLSSPPLLLRLLRLCRQQLRQIPSPVAATSRILEKKKSA
ncbi:unnamed protein product, partial [Arabidopsis halleri]